MERPRARVIAASEPAGRSGSGGPEAVAYLQRQRPRGAGKAGGEIGHRRWFRERRPSPGRASTSPYGPVSEVPSNAADGGRYAAARTMAWVWRLSIGESDSVFVVRKRHFARGSNCLRGQLATLVASPLAPIVGTPAPLRRVSSPVRPQLWRRRSTIPSRLIPALWRAGLVVIGAKLDRNSSLCLLFVIETEVHRRRPRAGV
jgi:hypothetical protein